MLDYSINILEGILVLKPRAPLSKEDFAGLAAAVDSYLAVHTRLCGVLIHSREFPGWEDFEGFTAHMHFVSDHQKKVERVAIVTDSQFADIAESFAKNFTYAEIKHFSFDDDMEAFDWLRAARRNNPRPSSIDTGSGRNKNLY